MMPIFLSIMPIARKLAATTDRMMALSALLSTDRFNVICLFSLSKLGYWINLEGYASCLWSSGISLSMFISLAGDWVKGTNPPTDWAWRRGMQFSVVFSQVFFLPVILLQLLWYWLAMSGKITDRSTGWSQHV
jgi:hypothetical protein